MTPDLASFLLFAIFGVPCLFIASVLASNERLRLAVPLFVLGAASMFPFLFRLSTIAVSGAMP